MSIAAPVRSSGRLRRPSALGVHDHACWAYESDDARGAAAAAWLREGVRLRLRGLYVAPGSVTSLRGELRACGIDAAVFESGDIDVVPTGAAYDLCEPIDARSQVAFFAAAVDQALAAGYRGLRLAADISPLVEDPGRRRSHLAWEQLVDRYIARSALSPLCLYDARTIRGIDAIVGAHPLRGPGGTPFALFGSSGTLGRLEGEVDALHAQAFAELLAALPGTDRRIDLGGLEFMDGHCAGVLHDELRLRRCCGQGITLVAVPRLLGRLWSLCRFDPAFLATG